MKIRIYCLILAIIFTIATQHTPSLASSYNTHRSIIVKTLPMDFELSQKIIPVVRVFITANGHIANVKGANKIVVAAKPETHRNLEKIFSSITIDNFDSNQLKQTLTEQFQTDQSQYLQNEIITLQYVKPKELIPALRSLVSFEGELKLTNMKNQLEIKDYPAYIDSIIKLIKHIDSK